MNQCRGAVLLTFRCDLRVACLLLLGAAPLLAHCGSKQDLVIGELQLPSPAGAQAGTGATAGTEIGGAAVGAAGAGGLLTAGTGAESGQGGATGSAGEPPVEDCVMGSAPPLGSLIHRYSFDGTGTAVVDSIGTANGELHDTELDGSGILSMDTKGQFVELPDGIISSLTDFTVVTWTTWSGEAAWGRVFDFGNNTSNYVAVMSKTGFEMQAKPGLGAEIKVSGFPTVTLASVEDMKNRPGVVSFVFRGGVSASLYLRDTLLATETTAITLADIQDVNNWIGQSKYADNPVYLGNYEEFRIYNVALDGCQLDTLVFRGPQDP
jgi:hypothetical protein